MVSKDEVTIVIPTLNEEQAIGLVLNDVLENGYRNVIVVDGHSDDKTVDIAKSKGIRVLTQNSHGKTAAVSTALSEVRTPYFLVMDGDATYSASNIESFLEVAEGHDEVIGARRKGREHIPMTNRVGNWVISKTFKLIFACPISDVCSGMYLLRTDFARRLQLATDSFDLEVEIASQARTLGKIAEIPIDYKARMGAKKLRAIRHGARIFGSVLWMGYYYNPVLLFSFLAALVGIPGLALLGWVISERLMHGIWHSAYALFGVMLLLISTQAFSVALMSLLIKRSELRILNAYENEHSHGQ